MKRGATRDEIIRATQDLITRNGIRAVRVDEIAQSLGISKRTLYELFNDKDELINTCLTVMGHQSRARISAEIKTEEDPLLRLYALTSKYINGLYTVDGCFLTDICHKAAFAEQYCEHQKFWKEQLAQSFEACLQNQEVLQEIDAKVFAENMMTILFNLRLGTASQAELQLFSRTVLRGAATQRGIERIDALR